MKVIQTVAEIGAESSGPSYSVPGLCRGLQQNGADVSLHVRAPLPEGKKFDFPCFAYPGPDGRLFRRLGVCPEMERGLRDACQTADVIQVNGLWMMQNVYPYRAVKGTNCKLVVAPRGTLAPWSLRRSRFIKSIFWNLYQRAVLANCDMFHATCEKEYEEIRAAGFRQPVAIVPIGMDIPAEARSSGAKVESSVFRVQGSKFKVQSSEPRRVVPSWGTEGTRKLVFFGRIHEVKGVDRLTAAWGRVASSFPEWELLIVGPDCGGKAAVDRIIHQEGIPRVSFVGELHGDEKYEFLRQSDLYVLPSFTENFAITVAEALACGTPVIASTGSPWQGVVREHCGWWVSNEIGHLEVTLRDALAQPDTALQSMGARGREWIDRDFSWNEVGRLSLDAYRWLCGTAAKPDCVREG